MALADSLMIATSGMKAQGLRLRVVAENIANAQSTAQTPGGQPYQRKMVTFKNTLDRQMGVPVVKVDRFTKDSAPFPLKYEPNHPAANEQGYVQYPNVNPIVEMMDMREARRGYEANIDVIQISKSMLTQTIGLLK